MNDRICRVLVFFNCTTAPSTGLTSATVTVPCTLRVFSAFFFCAKVAGAQRRKTASRASQMVFMRLFPFLVGFFFLVFLLKVVVVLVFLEVLRRFQFQGIGAYQPPRPRTPPRTRAA